MGTRRSWRAGCARAPTAWSAGRPTGRRRPARARRGCCTATTTTCRPSAGGRRIAAARSSPTTRATRRSSSAATPTAAGCCTRTAPAARTSCRAMPPHSMLTMSTVLVRGRGALGRDYAAYFARPYAVAHTAVLAIADYVRERRAAARQVRDDVQPRIPRPRMYALVRAWATVVQRDLQVAAVVGDMMAGRPVVYSTFLAYDEVAHHSGIERHDTLAVLRQVDRQIARVQSAVPDAPRPVRARRPVRPRPVAGRDVRGPLRRDARAPRPRGVRVPATSRRTPAARTRRWRYLSAGLTGGRRRSHHDRPRGGVGHPRASRRRGGDARVGRAGRGRAGRRAARDRGDGLGLPGPRQLPARARAGHAGAARPSATRV